MVFGRLGICVLGLGLSVVSGASVALADCGADVQKMTQDRMVAMKAINDTVVAAKGKQMDAGVFCAKSQPLLTIENKLIAYMVKNQDWCGIPEPIINQLKEAHNKSASFASKACKVAEQQKKAQESGAAANAPPPLPAGPL